LSTATGEAAAAGSSEGPAEGEKAREFRKFGGGFYIAFAGQRGVVNARIFGGASEIGAEEVV